MVTNGYASFYTIEDNAISFSVIDFIDCDETDSSKLFEAICDALSTIRNKLMKDEFATNGVKRNGHGNGVQERSV